MAIPSLKCPDPEDARRVTVRRVPEKNRAGTRVYWLPPLSSRFLFLSREPFNGSDTSRHPSRFLFHQTVIVLGQFTPTVKVSAAGSDLDVSVSG